MEGAVVKWRNFPTTEISFTWNTKAEKEFILNMHEEIL